MLSMDRRRLLALTVASVALLGSLLAQFVMGWQPCGMCWSERVLMAGILVVGGSRPRVAWGMAWAGFLVASVQWWMQVTHSLALSGVCTTVAPCDVSPWHLGVLTLAGLADMAFVAIIAALWPRSSIRRWSDASGSHHSGPS